MRYCQRWRKISKRALAAKGKAHIGMVLKSTSMLICKVVECTKSQSHRRIKRISKAWCMYALTKVLFMQISRIVQRREVTLRPTKGYHLAAIQKHHMKNKNKDLDHWCRAIRSLSERVVSWQNKWVCDSAMCASFKVNIGRFLRIVMFLLYIKFHFPRMGVWLFFILLLKCFVQPLTLYA